jgi:hypothetical protein
VTHLGAPPHARRRFLTSSYGPRRSQPHFLLLLACSLLSGCSKDHEPPSSSGALSSTPTGTSAKKPPSLPRKPANSAAAPPVPTHSVASLGKTPRPVIDGKLTDEAWQTSGALVMVNVGNGRALSDDATMSGRVRLVWDEAALFVAIQAFDTNILGGFEKTNKDPHLWTRSCVEMMLDPDGDGDNLDYYEIQIGPQNLVFDSQFDGYNRPRGGTNGPFGHQDWSSNLQSAVVVNGTVDDPTDSDSGYVVEARIPWSSFGKAAHHPPQPGDTWRANFYVMHENAGVAWSPILGLGNFHKSNRFGRLTFATNAGTH